MLVKEVLSEMLVRLGMSREYDLEYADTSPDEEISLMVRCINMTAVNLASCEMPLIKTQKVTAVNGAVSYTQMSGRVIDVKKLQNSRGAVRYKMFPEYIKTECGGEMDSTYSYLPAYADIGDNLELSAAATGELICLGAMCEYCIIKGRYEEGLIYEKRYKNLIKELKRLKREIVIPLRRW